MHILLMWAALALEGDRLAAIHDAAGRAEFEAGRYRNAQKRFERAAQVPDQSAASLEAILANSAQAAVSLGEWTAAEESIRRALALAPERAGLWHQLGQILLLRRKYPEAEEALRRSIALASAPAVWSDLAELYRLRKKQPEAVEYLLRAEALAPAGRHRARILTNLGVLYGEIKDKTRAVLYLELALREIGTGDHPDAERILVAYGDALRSVGRKAEAREAGRKADTIRTSFASQTNSRGDTVNVKDMKR